MKPFKLDEFLRFALVRVGLNENFVFQPLEDEDDVLTICDRTMVWNPAEYCFRCGDRFTEHSTVFYDEVNRRPFCEKCKGRKIKPRVSPGLTVESTVQRVSLAPISAGS